MRSVTTNKVRSFKPIKLPSSESCTPFLKAVMVFIILTHVIAVQRISTMYCMPVFCHFIGSSDSSDRFGQVRTEPVRFSPF